MAAQSKRISRFLLGKCRGSDNACPVNFAVSEIRDFARKVGRRVVSTVTDLALLGQRILQSLPALTEAAQRHPHLQHGLSQRVVHTRKSQPHPFPMKGRTL